MSTEPPKTPKDPISQSRPAFREGMAEWIRQLPRLRSEPQDKNFQLIDPKQLEEVLKDCAPEVVAEIARDMKEIDHDLMRLFRDRDYVASQQQNQYRVYQLGFMFLAFLATLFGSLQALAFGTAPQWVALFALFQTIISGMAVFLSVISTHEPPLPRWMENRRIAEFMRREFYRYMMRIPPYDNPDWTEYQRQGELAKRAARANNGEFPAED